MATYNGEHYIEKQLTSILSQINPEDEVIVVDDASEDRTLNIIENLVDDRIKIIALESNVGHVQAFEKAISTASNEIIFLSDQDDIWHPSKYKTVLEEFRSEESPVLLVHGLSAINSKGQVITKNWLTLPKACLSGIPFLIAELIKPRIFGSASAFRRSILEIMLPFPISVYAHDHWLTICAAITGKSKFLNKNLVYRRIHDHNLTPKNGNTFFKKIYFRILFFCMICRAVIRKISIKRN